MNRVTDMQMYNLKLSNQQGEKEYWIK